MRIDATLVLWVVNRQANVLLPTLTQALADHASLSNWAVFLVLGSMGPKAQEVADRLQSLLTHEDRSVRINAAGTLWRVNQDASVALPILLQELADPNDLDRSGIFEILGAMGAEANAALPALHRLLTNQAVSASLRITIAGTLWDIGRETNRVLEVCTNAMTSYSWPLNASILLGRMRTAAAPAVPTLLKVFQDTNNPWRGERGNAAMALGAARVSTPEIRGALLDGTRENQDPYLRVNCALALWRLDPQYAPLATRLAVERIVAMKAASQGDEQDFARWLELRDLDLQQSVAPLKQLIAEGTPATREEATKALQKIEAVLASKSASAAERRVGE